MRTFLERCSSRKFIIALLAGIIAFLKVYYPDIPAEAIKTVVSCLMGYVAIEGAIDAFNILGKWLAQTASNKTKSTTEL